MNRTETLSAEQYQALFTKKTTPPGEITAEQYRTKYIPKHTVLDEHQIQVALVEWFQTTYPGLLLFAIPNGGKLPYKTILNKKTGKNIQVSPERTKLMEEGMMPGIPDLFLAVPNQHFHGLFIEMKTPTGTVSDAQKDIHALLRSQGHYQIVVPFGLEPAKKAITDYLNER